MSLYMATISIDRGAQNDRDGRQVSVAWDDNDPNRIITAPIMVDHPITSETELSELLASQGWRVVSNGSDNVGRGFAVVARRGPNGEAYHPQAFYNPISGQWQAFLTDNDKREIVQRWPDAKAPGTRIKDDSTTGWVPFS